MDLFCLRFKLGIPILKEANRRLLRFTRLRKHIFMGYSNECSESQSDRNSARLSQDERKPLFSEVIARRRDQAKRTLLIETPSKNNFSNICEICEKNGEIKAAFNHTLKNGKDVFLVECSSLEMLQEILKYCRYVNDSETLPVYSRLLFLSPHVKGNEDGSHNYKLNNSEPELNTDCNTISAQMDLLYREERLHDLGTRMRFLICQQMEDALSGLFPHAAVLPFGSTVNGFGRKNCDLDMALLLNSDDLPTSTNFGLYFNGKSVSVNGRAQCQRVLETIADVLYAFMPGVSRVARILKARIPIVGFHHSLTEVECDLTCGNACAVYMSELLHLYGELDNRVRPLVFTVRSWAKAYGLTNKSPGPWITNFSLTLMVIFFLQNRITPILPSLNSLIQLADKDDVKKAEGVDCTFQRKVEKIPPTDNCEDAGHLLMEFFLFYEKFNFYKYMLSIRSGTAVRKPNGDTLHIENPLEPELNVSANVSSMEIAHMNEAIRLAIWTMEYNSSPGKSEIWGIQKLFQNQSASRNSHSGDRSLQVRFLFDGTASDSLHYVAAATAKNSTDKHPATNTVNLKKQVLQKNTSKELQKKVVSSNVSDRNQSNYYQKDNASTERKNKNNKLRNKRFYE